MTGKTTSKVFYSETVEPYVLRRETVKADPQGKKRNETIYEVVAFDVPYSVLGEILNTAHVKMVPEGCRGDDHHLGPRLDGCAGGGDLSYAQGSEQPGCWSVVHRWNWSTTA